MAQRAAAHRSGDAVDEPQARPRAVDGGTPCCRRGRASSPMCCTDVEDEIGGDARRLLRPRHPQPAVGLERARERREAARASSARRVTKNTITSRSPARLRAELHAGWQLAEHARRSPRARRRPRRGIARRMPSFLGKRGARVPAAVVTIPARALSRRPRPAHFARVDGAPVNRPFRGLRISRPFHSHFRAASLREVVVRNRHTDSQRGRQEADHGGSTRATKPRTSPPRPPRAPSRSTTTSATVGACCSPTPRTSRRSARPSSAPSPSARPSSTSAGVKLIGVSVDPLDSHQGWAGDIEETQGARLNFPLIADPDEQGRRPLRHDPPRTPSDTLPCARCSSSAPTRR